MKCREGYKEEDGKCLKKKNYSGCSCRGNPIVYNVTQIGTGFFGFLTILFIALKLTNFITWSWLIVLSPLWGPFIIFLVLYFIFKIFDKN